MLLFFYKVNFQMSLFNNFVDWLFPTKCIICGDEIQKNSIFCPKCFTKATFIDYPFCKICGKLFSNSYCYSENCICENCVKNTHFFDVARALFQYDDISKSVVFKIKKYADNNVAKICLNMLFKKYLDVFNSFNFIVPVPSHWSRVLKRGYNPADIISFELSNILNIPVQKILKRVKKTDYQKGKSTKDRYENVKNAFVCSEKNLLEQKIILVDDVMTTGATLNECSKILKSKNCLKIFCLTICTTKNI